MVMSEYTGPRRGADRAVLLAHGAGSDHRAPVLVAVADALAAAGVPALRFDYPYPAAARPRAPPGGPQDAGPGRVPGVRGRRPGLPPAQGGRPTRRRGRRRDRRDFGHMGAGTLTGAAKTT